MHDIGLLLVGWLLGLLAPAIVDGIRRRRESARVRAALKVELRELRYRLACGAYFIEMKFGTVNREYLMWVRDVVESYAGNNPKDAILKSVKMQLELSDDVIATVAQHERADPEKGAIGVKKYAAPLLDTRLQFLWELDETLQANLLEIRANLDLLNEEVDQARYYYSLTFGDLSETNRPIVVSSLLDNYRRIGRRAKKLADDIGKINL